MLGKSAFACELIFVSFEMAFALELFVLLEIAFTLELFVFCETAFALELFVLFETTFALELFALKSSVESSTYLRTDAEHSTRLLFAIDIESAHPMLVHGDSGPHFRVGVLFCWFKRVPCYWYFGLALITSRYLGWWKSRLEARLGLDSPFPDSLQ